MNKLLPLVLICALLCGCGRSDASEETTPITPAESVAGEITTPEEYGGAVTTIPLNLSAVRGLRVFCGNILLLSGEEHTVLTLLEGQTMDVLYSAAAEFSLHQEDPSFILHPDEKLSYFDPGVRETVVLDSDLTQVDRISAPVGLSGMPILSPDRKTLFYCTDTQVKALNLTSGISRCVKEMEPDNRQLTGVHMDGSVLQCQTQQQTLFLCAEDGTLLHQSSGVFSVITDADRYYCHMPVGGNQIALFGQGENSPQIFLPSDFSSPIYFLPTQKAVLTNSSETLEFRRLSDTKAASRLDLESDHTLLAADCLDEDTLVLLSYHAREDAYLLTFWDPLSSSPVPPQSRIVPYDDPDLSLCAAQAEALGNKYGIRILIGEDAARVAPAYVQFTAETLAPVLQWELDRLEILLSRYPRELIQQTAAHFSRLNLCLVREISGNPEHPSAAPGLQYLADSEAFLILPTGEDAEIALNHQLFHLMEIHILSESNSLDRWNERNPAGFRYDYDYAANERRDSGVYLFAENRSFVDTFSMSYPTEDRARILEYAMTPGQEALFRPKAMQAKLKTLCNGIRDAYNLKENRETFLWEQYLE